MNNEVMQLVIWILCLINLTLLLVGWHVKRIADEMRRANGFVGDETEDLG